MSGFGVMAAMLLGCATPPAVDVGAEFRRGMEALHAQRFREAEEAFGHVLAVAPNDAETQYLMGYTEAALGDLKGARKHYERAEKNHKDPVQVYRELGITYAKLGMRHEAEGQLEMLRLLRDACAGTCSRAGFIAGAVDAVAAAIAELDGVTGLQGHR
ncbi:MAG: tetratricopeptide repeat protein [Alphaproteobacteria bacterium]|nr:MAG: tetratricopeptide repeat protein [Alphaproteobacteria bacterium]